MKNFRFEFKKVIKQIVSYFLVFLFFSIIITQFGIIKINSIYKEEKEFTNLESQLVNRYISFHQYGVYGIRLKYSPLPMAALFVKSVPFWDMTAFIDMGVRLYIYKDVFYDNAIAQSGYLDISWLLTVLGCFLVSIWGWNTFRDKDYLKFLISIHGKRVKSEILMARITIIFIGILVIYVQILVQFAINGYSINPVKIGIYLMVAFVIYGIWFLIAAFMGIENTKKKRIWAVIIWITFVMLIPELVKFYFDKDAKNMIEGKFVHELKKVDIVMKVEKEAFKKSQRYPFKDQKFKVNVEFAHEYWNIHRKELERLEGQLTNCYERLIKKYQFINSLTPITFLRSTGTEISSQGYYGYLNFHKFTMEKQRGFLKYIFDKLYFKAPNYGPVKSFLKEAENIFRYNSMVPKFFWVGLLWCLTIIVLLWWCICWKLKKVLFKDEREKINDLGMTITKGYPNIVLTGHEPLKQHIYSYFAGKTEFKGELTIKALKVVDEKQKFIYLYKKAEMDAMFSPREMAKLLGESSDEKENWKIIFEHAKRTGKILIMDDFFEGLKEDEENEIINYIQKERLITVFITNDHLWACSLIPGDKIQTMEDDNTVKIRKKCKK